MPNFDFDSPILAPFAKSFRILNITPDDLVADEIKVKLKSLEGIPVPFEDIKFSPINGYALYYDEPVLIYIRDQRLRREAYEKGEFGKFHLCRCRTLETAQKNNRLESRYIVTANTSGEFLLNIRILWQDSYVEEGVYKRLKVCRNCLERIKWKNYNPHWNEATKSNVVENFSIEEFLETASKDLRRELGKVPTHLVKDNYVLDGSRKEDLKKHCRYKCVKCGKIFSSCELEVHHVDHNPGNNSMDNLMVVCIECHNAIHRTEGGYFG